MNITETNTVSTETPLNKRLPLRFRSKLVRALRSGRYKQATNVLRNPTEDAYDVVGVAYRLAGVKKGTITKMGGSPNGRRYNFLPKVIYTEGHVTDTLSDLNDRDMSFKWLASYIENNM